LKRQNKEGIAVAFFGDGALEEGIAFETLNMAALWKLPILYVCENNNRGAMEAREGGFSSSTMAIEDLASIPRSLRIATEVVDGEDADAVYSTVAPLVDRLRAGKGPAFVEALTERWPGSRPIWPELSTGITDIELAWEPDRITGEHADWVRDHDPILRYAARLVEDGTLDQDAIRAMDKRASDRMEAAKEFAVASPWPGAQEAYAGTFA
jgi:TPP-dependent pyruvate/acetoin dehydrogenase alpha subunit